MSTHLKMTSDEMQFEIKLEDTNEYLLNHSIVKCKIERKFSKKRRYSTLFEDGKSKIKESDFERLDKIDTKISENNLENIVDCQSNIKYDRKISAKRRYARLFEPSEMSII